MARSIVINRDEVELSKKFVVVEYFDGESFKNELLITEEAAVVLSLSPGTLRNLRDINEGPAYFKVANTVLYRKSDLSAYVDAQPVKYDY